MGIRIWISIVLVWSPFLLAAEPSNCDKSADIVSALKTAPEDAHEFSESKSMLESAIKLCPGNAEAYYLLGQLYEKNGKTEKAVKHYQETLKADPGFHEAWGALGKMRYKLKQTPSALMALLKGCDDDRSKILAEEIIEYDLYRTAAKDVILTDDDLFILFDEEKFEEMANLSRQCGFQKELSPVAVFMNLPFDPGSANLDTESIPQIEAIAAALKRVDTPTIIITGHTNKERFEGVSEEESERLNVLLSNRRANTIAEALTQRGISREQIRTQGFGYSHPLALTDSDLADAVNQRITIETETTVW